MKKFFLFSCNYNSDCLVFFVVVCVFLYIVWQLIMSGALLSQIMAVLFVLYFVITALVGTVMLFVRFARYMIPKWKNESAPTEVSAD